MESDGGSEPPDPKEMAEAEEQAPSELDSELAMDPEISEVLSEVADQPEQDPAQMNYASKPTLSEELEILAADTTFTSLEKALAATETVLQRHREEFTDVDITFDDDIMDVGDKRSLQITAQVIDGVLIQPDSIEKASDIVVKDVLAKVSRVPTKVILTAEQLRLQQSGQGVDLNMWPRRQILPEIAKIEDQAAGDAAQPDSNRLMLLHPQHPLMKRFQAAIKTQLLEQRDKLMVELQELDGELKEKKKEKKENEYKLYFAQDTLKKENEMLEKNRQLELELINKQQQISDDNKEMQERNDSLLVALNDQRRNYQSMRDEMMINDKRNYYLTQLRDKVASDARAVKRTNEKLDVDMLEKQEEKEKQDALLNRLSEQVHNLQERIAMLDAQTLAAKRDHLTSKESLARAKQETECLYMEMNLLVAEWQRALVIIQGRDDVVAALQLTHKQRGDESIGQDMALTRIRGLISKEIRHGENLSMRLEQLDNDLVVTTRALEHCLEKQIAMEKDLSICLKMLEFTDQDLKLMNTDLKNCEIHSVQLGHEINGIQKECHGLSDSILQTLREKATSDNRSKYTEKRINETRTITKNMEFSFAEQENDLTRRMLETNYLRSSNEQIDESIKLLDTEIRKKETEVILVEKNIRQAIATVGRQQTVIQMLNRKFDSLLAKTGGELVSPLELQVRELARQVEGKTKEVRELQALWLIRQTSYVSQSDNLQALRRDNSRKNNELLVLEGRQRRLNCDMAEELSKAKGAEREIARYRKELERIECRIRVEKNLMHLTADKLNFVEDDFVNTVKDAELLQIELASQLKKLHRIKRSIKEDIITTQTETNLWEKKESMLKETNKAVKNDNMTKQMEMEVHSMQLCLENVVKEQNRLQGELEQVVAKRLNIFEKSRRNAQFVRKGGTEYVPTLDAQRKQLRQANKRKEQCMAELSDAESMVAEVLRQKTDGLLLESKLDGAIIRASTELRDTVFKRISGFETIVTKQQMGKWLNALKSGAYKPLCRSGRPDDINSDIRLAIDKVMFHIDVIRRMCAMVADHGKEKYMEEGDEEHDLGDIIDKLLLLAEGKADALHIPVKMNL